MSIDTITSELRNRLVDSKGKPVANNLINSHNVLPLLSNGYYHHNLVEDEKLIPPLAFDKLLDAPVSTVAHLNVQPGQNMFLVWFTISSFFPLISACLGPLANMISIVGLAESWRMEKQSQRIIPDPAGIRVLNSLSLLFGLVGNMALLVNFASPKTYIFSQLTSIISWFIACMLLLAGILTVNFDYMNGYTQTQGQWLSVFTIVLYFTCTVTLSINMMGFLMGKYPPAVNLNKRERALMNYTAAMAVWLVIGTVVCRHMIPDLPYGASLYYCVVSVLTIGFGDILPHSSGSKAFILFFSLVGVIIMGLVIAMIRQVLHSTERPIILWHRMEMERKKCIQIIRDQNISITPEDSFQIMRRIAHKSLLEQQTISLMVSLFVFVIFWLIGALVFHYTEGWLYFNGVYFCLLCLITIGYGDYAPKTPLGRTFFICWAISAVPLMTILISNMGDTLFSSHSTKDIMKQLGKQVAGLFIISIRTVNRGRDPELSSVKSINRELGADILLENHIDEIIEPELDTAAPPNDPSQFTTVVAHQRHQLIGILGFLNQLKPIIEDTIDSPDMEYSHNEWTKLLKVLHGGDLSNAYTDTLTYWLSDESPLRLPLQEPNYFISRIFFKIEEDLIKLIKEADKELDAIAQSESKEY